MARLVLSRVLWSVPLLLLVSALSFVLLSLLSGNPAQVILGNQATAAQMAALSRQLGLDQPLPSRGL